MLSHHSFGVACRRSIYLPVSAPGIANGIAGGGTFHHVPHVVGDRRVGVDRQRHDDGRGRTELPRRHSRFSISASRSPGPDPLASAVVVRARTATGCSLLLLGSPHLFALVVPWLIGSVHRVVRRPQRHCITKRLAHVRSRAPRSTMGPVSWASSSSPSTAVTSRRHGDPPARRDGAQPAFEIQELQGLRSVLSLIINMIAALIFVVRAT